MNKGMNKDMIRENVQSLTKPMTAEMSDMYMTQWAGA